MRPLPAFIAGWLITGFGAFAGSVLGNSGGPTGLKWGAVAGGAIGVLAAVFLARRLSWLPAGVSAGAIVGGLIGFGIAVPITLGNMDTPLVPVLSCGLAGAGVLIGAGVSQGLRGGAVG